MSPAAKPNFDVVAALRAIEPTEVREIERSLPGFQVIYAADQFRARFGESPHLNSIGRNVLGNREAASPDAAKRQEISNALYWTPLNPGRPTEPDTPGMLFVSQHERTISRPAGPARDSARPAAIGNTIGTGGVVTSGPKVTYGMIGRVSFEQVRALREALQNERFMTLAGVIDGAIAAINGLPVNEALAEHSSGPTNRFHE